MLLSRPVVSIGAHLPRTASSAAGRLFSTSSVARSGSNSDVQTRIKQREAEHAAKLAEAKKYLVQEGYDEESLWEQAIVWGDHDQFQHVNNVRFVRFYESARMRFSELVAADLPPERSQEILRGTGISLILGNINVRYRRPVVYPDTLLIGQAALLPLSSDRFTLRAVAYSLNQRTIVSSADQLCVTYDYTKLTKCDLPDDMRTALEKRGKQAK